MTNKSVYTKEITARLVNEYKALETEEARKEFITAFASELGVKEASVRAKLVREEVYIKPERETKRKATKAELVAQIAKRVGKSEEALTSLEKATASALRAVLEALPQAQPEA